MTASRCDMIATWPLRTVLERIRGEKIRYTAAEERNGNSRFAAVTAAFAVGRAAG